MKPAPAAEYELFMRWIFEHVDAVMIASCPAEMARYYPTEQPAADTVPTAFLEKAA